MENNRKSIYGIEYEKNGYISSCYKTTYQAQLKLIEGYIQEKAFFITDIDMEKYEDVLDMITLAIMRGEIPGYARITTLYYYDGDGHDD